MSKDDAKVGIAIDADIYETIREFCDTHHIRLIEFIEDSLESATFKEEEARRMDEINRMKKDIKTECDKAFVRGFRNGVAFSLFSLQGNSGLSEQYEKRMSTGVKSYFRAVEGRQLDLFGNKVKK